MSGEQRIPGNSVDASRSGRRTSFRSLGGGLCLLATSACGVSSESPAPTQTAGYALSVGDFVIGTDPASLIQYTASGYPSVAASGENRLVAFYDTGRVRGVRFDDNGPLDVDDWLDFGVDDSTQYYPAVAFGEDRYLVVWYESLDEDAFIYGQAVSVDGVMLSERSLLASTGYNPQVAWLGDSFVLAWSDGDVHLERVGLDAQPIDGSAIVVSNSGSSSRPVLATSQEQGVVVFSEPDVDRQVLRAVRFDAEGTVLDASGIVLNPGVDTTPEIAVAAGVSDYLITFLGAGDEGVLGTLLDAAGDVGPAELPITSTDAVGGHATGYDGARYTVVWTENRDGETGLYATTVTSGGVVAPGDSRVAGPPVGASQTFYMDLVYDADRYSVVYYADGIRGQSFDAELSPVGDALPLSAFPHPQNLPMSTWDGQNYVLAWSDEREQASYQFRGTRISPQGSVLDPEGLAISQLGASASSFSSNSNGQVSAFVWTVSQDQAAYLRTLSQDGKLSDTLLLVAGSPRGVDVLSNGETFLVVYTSGTDAASGASEITAQFLDAAGLPQGDATKLVSNTSDISLGSWASGDGYLLAYSAGGTSQLLRLSAQGEVVAELPHPAEGISWFDAAGGADSTLFTWMNRDDQTLWARILQGDTWADPFLLTAQTSDSIASVAFNGTEFWTVWVEPRTSLWTRSVGLDGSLGAESLLLAGDYSSPQLAASDSELMLLSAVHWERYARTRRIESRLIGADGVMLPSQPGASDLVAVETDDGPADETSAGDSAQGGDSADPGDPAVDDPASGDTSNADGVNPDGASAGASADSDAAQTGAESADGSDPQADGAASNGAQGDATGELDVDPGSAASADEPAAEAASASANDAGVSAALSGPDGSEADSGCGCSLNSAPLHPKHVFYSFALLALAVLRRRRGADSDPRRIQPA